MQSTIHQNMNMRLVIVFKNEVSSFIDIFLKYFQPCLLFSGYKSCTNFIDLCYIDMMAFLDTIISGILKCKLWKIYLYFIKIKFIFLTLTIYLRIWIILFINSPCVLFFHGEFHQFATYRHMFSVIIFFLLTAIITLLFFCLIQ